MSPPPPNKKRKIATIETSALDAARPQRADTTNHPASLSKLPPPILGSAMDYLRYGEVRKAILVSRNFRDATKYVQTLNLCRTVEMHIPSAKRFTNATEINILCFLKSSGLDMGEEEPDSELDQDCLRRIIPFLAAWPGRLEKVFIGGLSTRVKGRIIYWRDDVILPDTPDHFDLYHSLIESFCGAFESGALPDNMELEGIRCLRYEEKFGPQCLHCQQILRHFPLRHVLEDLALPVGERLGNICISDKKCYEIVKDRPGGKGLLLSMQKDFLAKHVFAFSYEVIDQYVNDDEQDEEESYAIFDTFMRRMTDAGVTNTDYILHLVPEKIQSLQILLDYGCKPESLAREFIQSKLRNLSLRVPNPKLMLSKKTFNELVRMGFLFEEEDFVVVDVFTEPVFRPSEYDFLRGE